MRRLLIAIATSAVAACGGGATPAPPVVTPPSGSQTINGTERIGWDQPAADAVDLAAIRYAIYVDGARTEAAAVTCAPSATAAGFPCTARLPPLTAGPHTLQLASYVDDGGVLESARSAALQVNVTASTASNAPAQAAQTIAGSDRVVANAARSPSSHPLPFSVVVDGLDDPIDLAFAPDGRLFVAERAGSIRVVRDGRLLSQPALSPPPAVAGGTQLLAIAVDPEFARTRFVFVVCTTRDDAGRATFTLARFREAADTLADAAVLLDRIPAGSPPHAVLRFGADARLYAAFDAGGDSRRAGDPASLNGKLVRLNADGTTPRDQPSPGPAIADGLLAPAGLDWSDGGGTMWIADAPAGGPSQIRTLAANARYALPAGSAPSAVLFHPGGHASGFDGALLVASANSNELLRVRLDAATHTRPVGVERLAVDVDGGIQALAVARGGALYVATRTRIGTLPPDAR